MIFFYSALPVLWTNWNWKIKTDEKDKPRTQAFLHREKATSKQTCQNVLMLILKPCFSIVVASKDIIYFLE